MGLCLGTCSISIKIQTKSTAGWLRSIALVVSCSVPSHPMVVVMSSCVMSSLSLCHGQCSSPSSPSLLFLVAVSSPYGVPCCCCVMSYPVIVVSYPIIVVSYPVIVVSYPVIIVLYPIVVISYCVMSCCCCCIRRHRYALRRWALSLWHLLSRRGGPSSSSLFPEAGLVVEGSVIHYMCCQWMDGMRASSSGASGKCTSSPGYPGTS